MKFVAVEHLSYSGSQRIGHEKLYDRGNMTRCRQREDCDSDRWCPPSSFEEQESLASSITPQFIVHTATAYCIGLV